jgi:hypothetical protein
VHVFFDSGNIAAASTERGREPQWTQAMVLPYWIGNKGDVLEGGRAVVSLVLEERTFLGWCSFCHRGFGFGWSHDIQQMWHDGTIRPKNRKYSLIF